jgi:uncharacterized protein (TIGR03083 family)
MSTNPWPSVHAERQALADDLQSLSDDQWKTASLCTGWTVQQVLGHMTATAKMTPPKFFSGMIGSGFRFNSFAQKQIDREAAGSGADTLTRFRAEVSSTKHPPGPSTTWLGETIVHSEDIRRPLGIKHDYPADALISVADMYKGSNLLIGGKKRVEGLTLRATDTDWSTGSGPEVSGPMKDLVMAIAGRAAALDDLSGEGVETLRSRTVT